MSAIRRILTSLVATATLAAGAVTFAAPASANGDLLWFHGDSGQTTATFGANSPIHIGGKFYFKNSECPEDGVPDFFYPTSDVYIVVPGTEEGHLVDVTGGPPNTIVQYGSIFDDEIVGITAPAGKLPEGTFDVVFDTCQDGLFDADVDTFFSKVLTVTMPAGDLPAPDASLQALKQASYDEYQSWKNTRLVMNGVWKLAEKALKAGCKAGNPTACALKYGNYFSPIQEQFNGLLLNQGQHYLGIYEDPPNPSFKAPVQVPALGSDLDPATDAVAAEGALADALLKAVEAYKGAQQAGDAEWALVHARAVRDLQPSLREQLDATTEQLQAISDSFDQTADDALVWTNHYMSRVLSSGFDAGERRTLRENGLSLAQIQALEADLRINRTAVWRSESVKTALAANLAAHQKTAQALTDGFADWDALVAALKADKSTPDTRPVADAGGPYTATEGTPTQLSGSATGGTGSLAFAWDLDSDGQYDDATGTAPTVTFADDGWQRVGLRVTDGAGRTAFGWTTAKVARHGTAPALTGSTPAAGPLTVTTGSVTPFSVTVTDDAGTPTVVWTADSVAFGTGATKDWTAPAVPGTTQVTAVVTDADGHATRRSWDVNVHRADVDGDGWTATTDCNDAVGVVHPGNTEILGNGVDDDCDAGTADAPPGGLTGKVYAWGYGGFGLLGNGLNSQNTGTPTATILGDDVVQVEAGDRTTFVVKSDGTVRSWGLGISGLLGNGIDGSSLTPVSPKSPDGFGTLGSVTQIDADMHALARQSTGRVVAWGQNANRQLGTGSTGNYELSPMEVLTAPGTPLTDVVQVAAGESQSYALKSDGTVVGWGFVTCDGTGASTDPRTIYATPVPGLSHVRKITMTGTTAIFLLDDGTSLSCGSGDQILGRKYALSTPESPYVPRPVNVPAGTKVVDASMYGDVGVLATEDGKVLTWGQNTNHALNVLGLPAFDAVQFPTPVPLPPGAPVVDVENHDSSTTFAIRADGTMLVWGGNDKGINGVGSLTKVSTDVPTEVVIPGRIFVGATTAAWSSYALTRPADPTTKTPASWVSASVGDASFPESGGGAVTVTLEQKVRNDATFQWSVTPGTAGNTDVKPATGSVVIPAGQTSVVVPVPVIDDAVDEDDATFTFTLTSVDLGVQLARPQATGTIVDDDAAPTASVDDASINEGDTSLTDLPVHLRLSAPSGKEVVVTWATADGSATAGSDYVATGGEARFAPGETDHVVHLGAIGDTTAELTEIFTVGVTGGKSGTVALRDDERLAVSVQAPTVTEGTGSASTLAPFKLVLAAAPAPGETVDVPWTVVEPDNGNGDVAGDVVASSGTAHLTAAQPTATVTAGVVADALTEGAEHFALELGTPTSSLDRTVLTGAVASATIEDDDKVTAPTPTWPFTGFFAPVDNAPVVNVVKAGSAVPVKFSLGGNRGLSILAAGSPASAPHACSSAPTDALETTDTPGASTLTYDATSGRYHYVWQTAKGWAGTCRTFVLKLSDGTTHTAEFRFK